MKKSLMALAVMASVSGASFAQSAVQVYGVVDAGLEVTKSGVVDKTALVSGGQSGSRFGLKGTEDLGNGLSVDFVLEQGFSADTGAVGNAVSNAFGRQSWLAVSSKDVGSLRLGYQYTPIRNIVEAVDPFGAGLAGNSLKVLGNGVIAERTTNAFTYVSPVVSGFQGQLQYGLGETTASTDTNSYMGVNATYKSGPVMAGFGYAKQKTNLAPANKEAINWVLGGTYDLSTVKLHAAYAEGQNNDAVLGTSLNGSNVLVGVSAPFGAHTVMASYIKNTNKDLVTSDSDMYAVGYTYSLSKRTNIYASFARTTNEASVALNGASVVGASAEKYNVGLRHKF